MGEMPAGLCVMTAALGALDGRASEGHGAEAETMGGRVVMRPMHICQGLTHKCWVMTGESDLTNLLVHCIQALQYPRHSAAHPKHLEARCLWVWIPSLWGGKVDLVTLSVGGGASDVDLEMQKASLL